tara:strand:- start:3134 stop:3541 length:408 start_codon:yes stop_codon:yes gene_type:complete
MANEGRITISDGSTSFNIEPALLLEVVHREDFSYRDLNGYVRAKDVSSIGKLRQLTIEIPMGAVSRANWTQLNTWMTGGTEVKLQDMATNSTYYDATPKYFWGRISSLDAGAYSEAKMSEPPYTIVVDIDRFAAS